MAGEGPTGLGPDIGDLVDGTFSARMNYPTALAALPDGTIVFADEFNNATRKVDQGMHIQLCLPWHQGTPPTPLLISGAAPHDVLSSLTTN